VREYETAELPDRSQDRPKLRVRELLATYERQRDLILLGAYRAGSDRRVDEAIARIDAVEAFLKQGTGDAVGFADTLARLGEL